MKKIKSFWHIAMAVFIGTAALTFVSCGDDDKEEAPFLEVNEHQVSFGAEGGSKTFSVKSNTSWAIVGSEGWLSVSPSSGSGNQTITLTAESNSSSESKTSVLEVRSSDGSVSQRVTVEMAGISTSLSVSRESLTFSTAQGDIQHFTINCNTAWTISGQPDWLDIHPSAGSGTASVEMKTLTSNALSSLPRTATLVVSAGGKQVTVSLKQEAGLASNCAVRPNEITTLCNGIAFDCSYDSDVSFFYTGYMKASVVSSMTEAEIVAELQDRFTRKLPSDDPLVVFTELEANTTYMVYTLGYTKDGVRGDLLSKKISTNKALNNEPLALISNFRHDDENWYFSTTRSGTCSHYYMMNTQNEYVAVLPDAYLAWFIDDYVRRGKFESAYTADGDWFVPQENSLIAVWTRGYNTNDVASGEIAWNYGIIGSSTSPKKAKAKNKPTQKVQFIKKLNPGSYKVYRIN